MEQDGGGEENKRQGQKCPRCESVNTKFCYYNNYSLSQPRYYCKGCKRYWTQGGTLRNIPLGGASRKPNKRPSNPSPSSSSSSKTFRSSQQPHQMVPNLMAPPPPPPTVVQSYDYGGDAYLSFNIQPPPSYGAGITTDSVVGFGAAAASSSSFGSQSSRFYDQIGNLIAPSTARANSHGLHDRGTHRFANIGTGDDAASLWSTISTTSIISGGNSSDQSNTRGGSSSSSSLIPNSDYMPHLPGYAPPPPPPPPQ